MIAIVALVKISLVVAAAAALLAATHRRSSAAERHAICAVALATLALLPLTSVVVPRWTVISIAGDVADEGASPVADEPQVVMSRVPVAMDVRATVAQAAPAPSSVATSPRNWFARAASVWPWVVFAVYAVGVCAVLMRLLADHVRVRRAAVRAVDAEEAGWQHLLTRGRRQLGVSRRVRLLVAAGETTPHTYGVVRPVIVVPASASAWPEEKRRAVLLHELAHIARGDCLMQTLAAAVCALYWFHPGVWWLARRLRIERELACDDLVLRSGIGSHDYAAYVLEVAYTSAPRALPALAVGMAARPPFETRLLSIVDRARNRRVLTRRATGTFAVAALLLLLPFSALTVGQTPSAAVAAATAPQRPLLNADTARRVFTVDFWRIVASQQLARLGDQLNYLSNMRRLGYSMTDVEALLTLRQRGVTPEYVRELEAEGLGHLSTDDLLTSVDHGITVGFIRDMEALGYTPLDLATLVTLRRHGVDGEFVREMNDVGLSHLPVDALVTAREHGISPDYVYALQTLGYEWSLDDLATARSHGIDSEYVRALTDLGYPGLPLNELTLLRSHGVEPSFVRAMQALGYDALTPSSLAALRSHGVTASRVASANEQSGTRLSVDQLTRLAGRGWRQ